MSWQAAAARPYARAAFEFARDANAADAWSQALNALGEAFAEPGMRRLLGDPRVPVARLSEAVMEALGADCDPAVARFVRLLIERRRLVLAPQIAAKFEQLRAAAERRVDAVVVSARPLDEARKESLRQAVERRTQKRARLLCEVDPDLLGGAVVRIGDLVIDGSLRGRLRRLASRLLH